MRRRLDVELVRRGLLGSREQARRHILDRRVLVDGAFALKPASMVAPGQDIVLTKPPPPFVSRAGHKLEAALDEFDIIVAARHCLDVGSSTGGFTDCLLQRGAASVVAVDVGTNQLHERLRHDTRVTVREQTDIRAVTGDDFDHEFDIVAVDVSFISLRLILPVLSSLINPGAVLLALIKPQFEAGRREASQGRGIITDPAIWARVLDEVLGEAESLGLHTHGLMPSPVTGGGGNVEYVARLATSSPTIRVRAHTIEAAVDRAINDADRRS